MGDCIETVIEMMEQRVAALKVVAEKYPGCHERHYGRISVWVVDMPHEECTNVHLENHSRPHRGNDGYAILFKNVAHGVNIAPEGHYLPLELFRSYMEKKPEALSEVTAIFKEKGT